MNEPINDGGAAFPYADVIAVPGAPLHPGDTVVHEGMSLRDWFAGQALCGVMARERVDHVTAAKTAYLFADAMLRMRLTETKKANEP